jgi:hypothetical protein
MDNTIENRTTHVKGISKQVNIEITSTLKYIRQVMHSTNPKKTMQLQTKEQTPQCEVEHEKIKSFFDDRCKTGDPIKKELEESKYELPRTLDESRKKIIEDLKDIIKMKENLRTRGNLSASGHDGITISLIKLERENRAKKLI